MLHGMIYVISMRELTVLHVSRLIFYNIHILLFNNLLQSIIKTVKHPVVASAGFGSETKFNSEENV